MNLEKKLNRSIRRQLGLAAGAVGLSLASSASMAAVVCSSAAISIPANIDGVYINFVTGATGTTGGSVAGWDFNPYQTGSAALYFFWPTTPANSYGGVATGTVYQAWAAGQPVSAAQTYSTAAGGGGAANYVNWQTANTGKYLGVRFYNEATSAINYGWAQIDTGASGGFPATINQYCYDNTGAAINTGTTPVTLQQFGVD